MNSQTSLLFYLFIGIFSITAIITLLGITGVLKSIKDKYLNAMFSALILEVVAAVILSYKQIDLNCDSDALIDKLVIKSGATELESKDDKIEYLKDLISDYKKLKPEYDSLQMHYLDLEKELTEYTEEHSHTGNAILLKVIRLREITSEMDGSSINLVFDRESKKEVFDILETVFKSLGKVDPRHEITPDYITDVYITFLSYYGLQEKLLSTNDAGIHTGVYLTDYVTTLMIRAYLEKFSPI